MSVTQNSDTKFGKHRQTYTKHWNTKKGKFLIHIHRRCYSDYIEVPKSLSTSITYETGKTTILIHSRKQNEGGKSTWKHDWNGVLNSITLLIFFKLKKRIHLWKHTSNIGCLCTKGVCKTGHDLSQIQIVYVLEVFLKKVNCEQLGV